MLSLPIPDAASPVCYNDLSLGGHSFGKIVTDLKAKRHAKTNKLVKALDRAHLDPDLIRELQHRAIDWRPLYGQCGKDATILRDHQVGVGDLFVFFGWFKRCELVNGKYCFSKGGPNIHVIFGYLRVGEILPISPDAVPTWTANHPHLYGNRGKRNVLFVAADRLQLPGAPDLPGAAAFPKYSEALRLTAPGMSRSCWRLPRWFYPEQGVPPLSSHERADRWQMDGDHCVLESVARGQEFVLQVEHYPKVVDWITAVICDGLSVSVR
jgi:hypothetical protein